MRFLNIIARFFVGGLFIFSGLIKLNDPTGTAIKLEEYFEVFASDISPFFMNFVPYSMFLSVFLSTLEVVLGVALLVRYRPKLVSWLLLLIIIFFSFLTFYSAYFDKVTDCGCFGDFIKLKPWTSFTKDIILLVLILFLFSNGRNFTPSPNPKISMLVVAISLVLSVYLAVFALRHLPPIDFLTYKLNANIPALMKPSGQLKFKYIMEKDGKKTEFTDYPSDTTFKMVEMVELNPEVRPKITDFKAWDAEGNDMTDSVFSGNKLIVVIGDVNKTDRKSTDQLNQVIKAIRSSGIGAIALTSSQESAFEEFRHEEQLAFPYYFVDATVLKAMIRANPGLILISNGVVKGKWHYNDIPTPEVIKSLI